MVYIIIGILVYISIVIAIFKIKDNKIEIKNDIEYKSNYAKKNLLTKSEINFYKKLNNAYKEKYIIQCQINLASIIYKINNDKYRSELFRNIDYGLFEKETFKPLIMIELNDQTHKNKKRYIRDLKVRDILQQANIPLITFYTEYENKENYITKRIDEILN